MRNRRQKGRTYPENWRRCRDCGAIVPLEADHDCQSASGEGKHSEADDKGDD